MNLGPSYDNVRVGRCKQTGLDGVAVQVQGFLLKIICTSNPFVKTGMSDKYSCISGCLVLEGAAREPQFGHVCSTV
jgi:hypothetical protein